MIQVATDIYRHLGEAKKVVLIPHQHPDADALGAATALFEYFRGVARPATIFCATPVNPKLHFLPHATAVHSRSEVFHEAELDTVIVVDSGDLRYAGVAKHLSEHPATIINIDHHATNEHFGRHNLVIPTASSTSEIIFHWFKHNRIAVNQRMATSLLAGLLTDTGHFSNAATSATALQVASELLRAGGNWPLVNAWTVRRQSVATLRLWGLALSRLEKYEPLNLTHTYLTAADLASHGVNDQETEGIANFLNDLGNTDIALILKETADGQVKGSLRTTCDTVDVAAMAQRLGGGGHKKAAGFTAEGTIKEVLDKILTINI